MITFCSVFADGRTGCVAVARVVEEPAWEMLLFKNREYKCIIMYCIILCIANFSFIFGLTLLKKTKLLNKKTEIARFWPCKGHWNRPKLLLTRKYPWKLFKKFNKVTIKNHKGRKSLFYLTSNQLFFQIIQVQFRFFYWRDKKIFELNEANAVKKRVTWLLPEFCIPLF